MDIVLLSLNNATVKAELLACKFEIRRARWETLGNQPILMGREKYSEYEIKYFVEDPASYNHYEVRPFESGDSNQSLPIFGGSTQRLLIYQSVG